MPINSLIANCEFLTAINSGADQLRTTAAEVATEVLGCPIEPDYLPRVQFVVNDRTSSTLDSLRPWSTPAVIGTQNTLWGKSIQVVEIHPQVIVQRYEDVAAFFGNEEITIQRHIDKTGIPRDKAAASLAICTAYQIMTEATLRTLGDDLATNMEVVQRVMHNALA